MKYLIVLTNILLSSLSVYSQETENSAPDVAQPASAENNPPSNEAETTSSTDNEQSDFDVFQPSEEISEDLSVPFPVDI